MKRLFKTVQRYCRQTVAAIAIMFALMAPVIIGSAGMALDFANAYLVQQRLAQALDAAALAAAASSTDATTINQKVQQFFDANYPEEKLGITFEPFVVVDGDQIYVSGRAVYKTYFLTLIGITEIDVEAETTVQREVQGIEVALVLDNTGSMSTNDNIGKLRNATRSFINIMFAATSNPNFVRIGLVPYSNAVNVGRYGLGKKPDGSTYGDGVPFVTLPSGVSYTTSKSSSTGWYGCVVEHKDSGYSASATHVNNSFGQLWRSGTNWSGHGWNPAVTNNDPYDYDTLDNYEGNWDIYMYGRVINSGQQCSGSGFSSARCSNCTGNNSTCASTYCYCRHSTPSTGCPNASIMPISSDKSALLTHVDRMQADGNTLGNIGMAWGARLISPEPPFEEGSPWDSEYWKKAIIMMTDGDNTLNGTYSAYWFTNKTNMSATKFDTRFSETCEELKEKGVLIYTIVFSQGGGVSTATKNRYQACASSEDQYIEADDTDALQEAFEQIARELSNLHIKG